MPAKPKPKPEPTPEVDDEEEPSGTVEMQFRGKTFTIPRSVDDWPTVAYLARLKATTSNLLLDWMTFVELILGEKQWQQLTLSTAARSGDFGEFVDLFGTTVAAECQF